MPIYNDAATDALDAAEAARALAHATHDLDDPDAAYRVLSALSSIHQSLQQTLEQLAAWHDRNADRAYAIDAPLSGGTEKSRQVANDLRFAALSIARASAHVDKAWSRNGRIVWAPRSHRPAPSPVATPDRTPAPAEPDGIGH